MEPVAGRGTEAKGGLAAGGSRRWVFEHTVQGLFHVALRGRLSPSAREALCRAGLDLNRPLLPAYSYETWRRALEISALDLYPLLPREEAWRRLGHSVVEGMVETLLGKAMAGVAHLLGPLRSLRRFNGTLRSADNYVESRLEELSPTACRVWINEVMEQPAYYQGILEASVALAGGQRPRARLLSREGAGAWLHVEWDA
jgi:uncharacterized protein (TIGR02265 family)